SSPPEPAGSIKHHLFSFGSSTQSTLEGISGRYILAECTGKLGGSSTNVLGDALQAILSGTTLESKSATIKSLRRSCCLIASSKDVSSMYCRANPSGPQSSSFSMSASSSNISGSVGCPLDPSKPPPVWSSGEPSNLSVIYGARTPSYFSNSSCEGNLPGHTRISYPRAGRELYILSLVWGVPRYRMSPCVTIAAYSSVSLLSCSLCVGVIAFLGLSTSSESSRSARLPGRLPPIPMTATEGDWSIPLSR